MVFGWPRQQYPVTFDHDQFWGDASDAALTNCEFGMTASLLMILGKQPGHNTRNPLLSGRCVYWRLLFAYCCREITMTLWGPSRARGGRAWAGRASRCVLERPIPWAPRGTARESISRCFQSTPPKWSFASLIPPTITRNHNGLN